LWHGEKQKIKEIIVAWRETKSIGNNRGMVRKKIKEIIVVWREAKSIGNNSGLMRSEKCRK